ncbi:hypothetical protein Tco_0852409, partial [Tanacetum coccineum]
MSFNVANPDTNATHHMNGCGKRRGRRTSKTSDDGWRPGHVPSTCLANGINTHLGRELNVGCFRQAHKLLVRLISRLVVWRRLNDDDAEECKPTPKKPITTVAKSGKKAAIVAFKDITIDTYH